MLYIISIFLKLKLEFHFNNLCNNNVIKISKESYFSFTTSIILRCNFFFLKVILNRDPITQLVQVDNRIDFVFNSDKSYKNSF